MAWSLGKRLKIARIERGISQRQLAQQTGLRQSHLSMIENNKHDPSATMVRTLAHALGVSADYLLGLSNDVGDLRDEEDEAEPLPAGSDAPVGAGTRGVEHEYDTPRS